MKKTRRIWAGMLCVMMLTLTACSGKAKQEGQSNVSEKGRYLETTYAIPEGEELINAMEKLENGKLRLAGSKGVYDSEDNGLTWKLSEPESAVLKEHANDYATDMAIDPQGRLYISYYNAMSILVDTDGTVTEMHPDLPDMSSDMGGVSESSFSDGDSAEAEDSDASDSGEDAVNTEVVEGEISTGEEAAAGEDEESEESNDFEMSQNMLHTITFAPDGTLVGFDYTGGMYRVNLETGEILNTYESSSVNKYAIVGDKLVVISMTSIEIFNLETGAMEEADPALKEYFEGRMNEEGYYDDPCAITAASDDSFYYADANGLYRYTFGSSEMELLISGTLSSMGNPSCEIQKVIEGADNTFLILYMDGSAGQYTLKHYEFSEDISTTPKYEISVYSLEDNQDIRIAIANFQAANPDYYVKLEVGMSGEDGVTASDAISKLNTNTMAGDGPDVLLMDGLPMDSYMEKGLLADLSELVDEQTKDRVFYENILKSLASKDGLYVMPTRFKVPVIGGTQEDIDAVTDLASLSEKVQALRAGDAEVSNIMGRFTAEELLSILFMNCQTNILTESGTVDEAALSAFLEAAKAIFEVNEKLEESDAEAFTMQTRGLDAQLMDSLFTILQDQQKLNVGWLAQITDMKTIEGLKERMGWNYQALQLQNQKTFLPVGLIGMNAKSANSEHGMEFIKYLLSEEIQSNRQLQGLPVSESALDQSIESSRNAELSMMILSFAGEDGVNTDVTFEEKHVTDESVKALKESIREMDTPLVDNSIISAAVYDAGASFLDGQTDLSQAVETIIKTVNLYLSE